MRRLFVILAAMLITTSAHAVQTVTLKDVPPLKPLNYCKHADGTIDMQRDDCGPDTTTVPAGTPLEPGPVPGTFKIATPPRNEAVEINKASNASKSQMFGNMGDALMHYGKIAGIALVVGVLAKLLGQSFWLWSILGLGVRELLVVLNVISS